MSDIKIWATNFSVILIVTGLITKLINGKSEKNILRFVVMLVIISTVFSLKGVRFDDFSSDISEDFENEISYISDALSEKIKNEGMSVVKKRIEEIIKEFDSEALIDSEIYENKVEIEIRTDSTNLNIENLKLILKEDFDCEFEIFLRKK